MEPTINDLRADYESLHTLRDDSALWREIRRCTGVAVSKLGDRLTHEMIDSDDAFQIARIALLSPINSSTSVSVLEHYLIEPDKTLAASAEGLTLTDFRRLMTTIIANEL